MVLNGITIAFLMNDVLILYGIRNGLTDPQVAFLASFLHLAMPFMIFGKLIVRRIGLAKNWGPAWLLRYISATLLIIAPFFSKAESSRPVVFLFSPEVSVLPCSAAWPCVQLSTGGRYYYGKGAGQVYFRQLDLGSINIFRIYDCGNHYFPVF